MGIVRMGPPEKLIMELKDKFQIDNFIETGTFHGGTACWAARKFKKVFTIEFSEKLYSKVIKKYPQINNIEFIFGDSKKVLEEIKDKVQKPSIIWLDAHFCEYDSYGEDVTCPLIEEIKVINNYYKDSFIFIDDARCFLAPYVSGNMQEISEIILELNKIPDRYIVIIEDVIIAVPNKAKAIVRDYCLDVSSNLEKQSPKVNQKSLFKKIFKKK